MEENKAEPKFFLVEWSQSREAKIALLHEDVPSGINFLKQILRESYGFEDKPNIVPIKPTEETLAKAGLSTILTLDRKQLVEIYPHPYEHEKILLEGQEGEVFEIEKNGGFHKSTLSCKSPLLEFWSFSDAPLYDYHENEYFYL